MRWSSSVYIAVVVATIGCSSTSTSSQGAPVTSEDAGQPPDDEDAAAAAVRTVEVNDFAYDPAKLTIKVGDTVEWRFTGGTHSVTSGTNCTPDGHVDSKVHGSPYTFRHTFTEAGRFDYFCNYREHCTEMGQVGSITISSE